MSVRFLAAFLLFAFAAVACGRTTDELPPPAANGPVVPGGECVDIGATAPAEDGCNSCACGDDGWSCTEIACPPPPVCTEGETKLTDDGCNTCTCSENSWSCTNAVCLPPGAECTPGESTGLSCAFCQCLSNGTWDCIDDCGNLPPPMPCTEGYVKSAGDGCNTCSCAGGNWVCTAEDCPEPECPIPDGESGPPCQEGFPTLYGRAAGTDACCELCSMIEGYAYYATMANCEAATRCSSGQAKEADDGCNTCTCASTGEWQCSDTGCTGMACGGFTESTCPEDEYCAYKANVSDCGSDDVSSTCKPRPSACTEEEAPVCGCDGETYSNACLANMAGTGVRTNLPCSQDE